VVEAEVAGFGASGRNGGWCSALFPTSLGEAQDAAMRTSVDEVRRVAEAEGIDCHFAKGGTIVLARSRAQLARARVEYGDEVLSPAAAAQRLRATRTLGATYTPDCAAIHPGRLVRGLADVVTARGVVLYEQTPATSIEPGRVRTPHGSVRAPYVVRATEGYTPRLPGLARAVVPVYSLIIATEPLAASVWDEIGLAQRETFADHRHLIIYGQRTADDRLVFGGRGAPYHLRSRIEPGFDRDPRVFAALHATLLDLFPVLSGTRFTHAWGGPLGIARDWCASVGLDRSTGLAWAGGYVGDGVSTTNLAGRTLADLVLERDSDLLRLPWVGHRSPSWEPEPLRWLGINAGLRAMTLADAEERVTGRPSVIGKVMAPLVGGHSA
jgi:glycine/D-amino acid oxidase-like deaminating enzyme